MSKGVIVSLGIIALIVIVGILTAVIWGSGGTLGIANFYPQDIRLQGSTASTEACKVAEQQLSNYINQQFRQCKVNEDCGVYYLMIDSCAPPIALAQSNFTDTLETNRELQDLQLLARSSCLETYSAKPVCELTPAEPVCRNGLCGLKN